MNRSFKIIVCAIAFAFPLVADTAQFKFPNQTLTVPDGFEVEIAAGSDLAPRPIYGSFDELGRLYVADSSGASGRADEQLANPQHRILRLEDADGDGKFDKQTAFADKMMFPEGCLYYDGSVYVCAPPQIWKLTDTNSDGIADVREVWHDGKTLTGCANDLHGPYLGPDGWIYWCKGAFAEQSYEVNGKPWKSRASHIFRARPDHSRFEPVATLGCDNPVGLAWSPEGELFCCATFLAPHEPGHRDGMIHAVYGGVWGKPNAALEGHKMTGDLMPVMTHMGAAAPASVRRYESGAFGEEYRNNLFCCQFNMHKVSRHVLVPDGATFKTQDSDFLVSDNPDFHPTDVVEDADGSLLVLDTGAWYKICCPTSQLAKPDVLGTIYRIRRKGAPKIADPRGLKLAWKKMKPAELTKLLSKDQPAVVERATRTLAESGDEAITALASVLKSEKNLDARRNAAWALTRIESPAARRAIYAAFPTGKNAGLRQPDSAAQVAIYSIGLWRDANAIHGPGAGDFAATVVLSDALGLSGSIKRMAIEARGRTSVETNNDVRRLLRVPENASLDRAMQHAVTFALIEINNPNATRAGLKNPALQRIALIALDQMDSGDLKPEEVAPLLKSPDAETRKAAVWVSGHHPEWGSALAGFFRERIMANNLSEADRGDLENQLNQFVSNDAIQQVIVESLKNFSGTGVSPVRPGAEQATNGRDARSTMQMLLRVMAQPGLKNAPNGWADAVRAVLDEKDDSLVRAAIATARALSLAKANPPNFSERLQTLARDKSRPDDLRLDALAALPRGLKSVDADIFEFLRTNLDPSKSVAMRSAASGVLAKAKLSDAQLLALADTLKTTGPMEVSRLLPAFAHPSGGTTSTSSPKNGDAVERVPPSVETIGLRLIAALKESKGLSGVRPDTLRSVATNYPAAVQTKADELLAFLNQDAAKQAAHLEELLASWPKGDIRRGQLVFNSTKAACASCHRMGSLGGRVGPDLTSIGQARTERDLLESIVYPSASFVRSFEPLIVVTKSDEDYSGVVKKDGEDEIVLATGPNTEVHVARGDIAEMRPGTVSVMPAGLDQLLTKQELADLVTFLKNTKWGAN